MRLNVVMLFGRPVPIQTVESPFFHEIEEDYDVEFWNVQGILDEGIASAEYGISVEARSIKVDSLAEVRKRLAEKNPSRTIFVITLPRVQCKHNLEKLLREVCAEGFDYAVRDITNSFGPRTDFDWVKSSINRIKRKSILGYRNRRAWFWRGLKPPIFALVASKIIEDGLKIQGLRTRYVRAHSRDYESYLVLTRVHKLASVSENVGLFLDQGFTTAADHKFFGWEHLVEFEAYHEELGLFIKKAMTQWKLDGFRIALHPSNFAPPAEIQAALKIPGIEVLKGDTPDLVRRSALVASEDSSALALAVLFNKPVAFFQCTRTNPQSWDDPTIAKKYARLLGRRVNYPDTQHLDGGIDRTAYERFRRRYVKEPDTLDDSHFRILGRELQQWARSVGSPVASGRGETSYTESDENSDAAKEAAPAELTVAEIKGSTA